MPQILTKYFGSIEYQEADVIQFPSGLPAFEQETEFVLIEPPSSAPMVFLQSLPQSSLCFLALSILAIAPDYSLAVTTEDLQTLHLEADRQPRIGDEVACLALIAVAENGRITANLLAPIVINRLNRRAVQAIRIDTTYSHQHQVAAQPEDVCS
jgi:flagellar assembly factor FliW